MERGGLTVGAGVEVGAAYLHTEDTNFGAGRVDLRSGDNTGDAQWGEGYFKPLLDLTFEAEGAGTFYGAASAIGSLTVGDGDAGGFTDDGDKQVDLEDLYGGWRSGDLLAELLGEDALDLSLGRQQFQVGDGFLIWDGNFDNAGDGAYWLGPRRAFDMTGLVQLNTEPFASQLFYLKGDRDHGDAEAVGINLDYQPGFGTLGATYLQIVDAEADFDAEVPRDGLQALSFRLNELSYPAFEDATLNAEFVQEFGDGDNADFDAYAFYVEPAYTFSGLPWTPNIAYRFAYFTGDPDPDDGDREDFDPLFYEGERSWGTWTQGEIVGNYLLFNSNQVNHMVHLSAYPTEAVGIGAIYFHFDLEEKDYFGTAVGERDFADEVDVYADWTITDNISVGALYGVAFPGDAAEEAFGADDPFHLFETYVVLSF